MALVEIEILALQFSRMVDLIVTSAPTPVPTLAVLGSDRLIDGMTWEHVTLGLAPPNYTPPAGTLAARAIVHVHHVSIAELDANPQAARTETALIASLIVTVSPDEVIVSAIQFDIGTVAPFAFALPLRIGRQPIPLQGFTPVAAALLQRDNVVTLRLSTSGNDELNTPAANRIEDTGSRWLVRVSGELFRDQVLQQLRDAVTPPPGGTIVEDQPSAVWESRSGGPWQVFGSVGVMKPDACPTLFGAVDLSITIDATLVLTPNANAGNVGLRLVISSDVSDWDVLRCWAGSGGVASLVLAAANPALGAGAAIASLVTIGEVIRGIAGSEVTSTGVGGFREVARDDTSVTYEGTAPLPLIENKDVDADVGPEGLIVRGDFITTLVPANRRSQFNPDGGVLRGAWAGGFSCSRGSWDDAYVVDIIGVRDRAFTLDKFFRNLPVTVWPTSLAVPSAQWRLNLPRRAIDPQITIDALVDPPPGQTGRIFLHTSAGVRCYDLAPVPVPKEPTTQQIVEGRLNCLKPFLPPAIEFQWLPDPPPFDLGLPAVRQWLVVISELSEGAVLNFHRVRDRHDIAEPVRIVAPRSGPASFEFVTDATTTLEVRHNSEAPSASCRVMQRWLIPVRVIDLPAAATALVKSGETLTVHTADEPLVLHTRSGEIAHSCAAAAHAYNGRPPFSVRLDDGMLAAAWGDKLLLARPWEGNAQAAGKYQRSASSSPEY